MRKMKKINGYLVVRFNDREKREYEGTGLGNYGVIDAELYTGVLDVDRGVMEYDSAETLAEAVEQARGLESELDIVEPEAVVTVIVEREAEVSEETVEPAELFRMEQTRLEGRILDKEYPEVIPASAAQQLEGYAQALADLGMIDRADERFVVSPDHFVNYLLDEPFVSKKQALTKKELKSDKPPSFHDIRDALISYANSARDANFWTDTEQIIYEMNGFVRALEFLKILPEKNGDYWRDVERDILDASLIRLAGQVESKLPSRNRFVHLTPERWKGRTAADLYRLGKQLNENCPENDCAIYRNIFRMAKELDESLDSLGGYTAEVVQRELCSHVREMRRMYFENYAVKKYRETQEVYVPWSKAAKGREQDAESG